MDYGGLIRQAWETTWRYRFLWVLGLFAGGSASGLSIGSNTGWRGNPGNFGIPSGRSSGDSSTNLPPDFAPTVARFFGPGGWVQSNIGLIVGAAIGIVALALLFFVIGLIARGGMARATADIATGRSASSDSAWNAGVHYFWRNFGLALLTGAIVLVIALVVGAVAAVLIAIGAAGGAGVAAAMTAIGVILGIVSLLVIVPFSIAFGIVIGYARRALVVEDLGPIGAVSSGISLLRRSLGKSLLVWLISIALGIGAGIGLAIVAAVAAIPLTLIGIGFWAAARFTAPTIIYVVVAVTVFICVLWVLGSIVNTFFWSYWTNAYLTLSGRLAGPPAEPSAA